MWFLKLLFKKRFDPEFITRFFQALSEHIPDVELIWKKGGSEVALSSASSAVIKRGKKVLYSQGSRFGWIDPFSAGDYRSELIKVAEQFQLGREKPNYWLSLVCVVVYLVIVTGAIGAAEESVNLFYAGSVIAALLTSILMIFSYRADWSHNLRSLCTTLWILAMIAGAFSSILLLPIIWTENRQQLARTYSLNRS
ncbi:hypothetical protein EKN56_04285 [Limnobaculum zhutongyuii]|uniref:Uncharacterized protein n=1 Tax=Limnobaculum zhutongyuii TaxID=2498113 RepID=A0A411WHJ0_9GAMM|nr:hypothetical protein [Limnobaculum zhutongyuii]QBH95683.1 hypothetical protein EKN56_04285 [Limnobaculum zhutongyuii]TQS86553.1 hypothetical protein ELQ32_18625 [Limnobaculum zhutongyuii]